MTEEGKRLRSRKYLGHIFRGPPLIRRRQFENLWHNISTTSYEERIQYPLKVIESMTLRYLLKIYIAPLQETYSEALPSQPRQKEKITLSNLKKTRWIDQEL